MKKILIALLCLAAIIETGLTILAFFAQEKAMELFGLPYIEEVSFLGFIIAWFLLFATVYIGYCALLVANNNSAAKNLIYIISIWWIGLGIGVFIKYGKIDNLLLDSAKGLLIAVCNTIYHKKQATSLRN
jgi:hypothetical protein